MRMTVTPDGRPTFSRRQAAGLAVAVPLAGLATAAAAGQCVREDELSTSELSLRKSLRYEEPSADAAKTCAGCAFFAAEDPHCGLCKLLNSPVAGTARCSSWAPKPR